MKSICPHYIHLPSCTEWFLCTLPHCTPSEKQLLMNRFTIRRQTDPGFFLCSVFPVSEDIALYSKNSFYLTMSLPAKHKHKVLQARWPRQTALLNSPRNTQHGGSERTSTPGIISVPHEGLGFERLWAPEGICYPFHPATYTCLLHSPPTSAPRSALCTREKQNQLERIQFHLNPSFCQRTRKGRTT